MNADKTLMVSQLDALDGVIGVHLRLSADPKPFERITRK
jgi:hypothetical protein